MKHGLNDVVLYDSAGNVVITIPEAAVQLIQHKYDVVRAAPDLLEAACLAIDLPLTFLDLVKDIETRTRIAEAYNKLALAINKANGRI